MLAPCNCMVFVNTAVLVLVITLSLYVSNIYCTVVFALLLRFVQSFWAHCFEMEDKSWYAVPSILMHCLLVVYTEGIEGSDYFVVPNDTYLLS